MTDTTSLSNTSSEIDSLLKNLEILQFYISEEALYRTPLEAIQALPKVIELLKNGEPFNPEPHPDSGQGKWKEAAATMSRNSDFYQDIVNQVGNILGGKAYEADDGSISNSVLALKVPELVNNLKMAYVNKVMDYDILQVSMTEQGQKGVINHG